MNRFIGEILYVTAINSNLEKKIFKVKTISRNTESCKNCKFAYFTGRPTVNLVVSCFRAKRCFLEVKICNELKKNNLTF